MSAFMHNEIVFNSIGATLSNWLYTSNVYRREAVNSALAAIKSELNAETPANILNVEERAEWQIANFCAGLHRANQISVDTRYAHIRTIERAESFAPSLMSYYKPNFDKGKALSAIELVKLLHSVHYQSCEPDEWDAQPICKALNRIIAELESHIVRTLPEYDKAAWAM